MVHPHSFDEICNFRWVLDSPNSSFAGCKIRRVDEKMKCSKTYQNELKTCQNECECYSEFESDSEMSSKLCFIRVLMISRLIFCTSTLLILLGEAGITRLRHTLLFLALPGQFHDSLVAEFFLILLLSL